MNAIATLFETCYLAKANRKNICTNRYRNKNIELEVFFHQLIVGSSLIMKLLSLLPLVAGSKGNVPQGQGHFKRGTEHNEPPPQMVEISICPDDQCHFPNAIFLKSFSHMQFIFNFQIFSKDF